MRKVRTETFRLTFKFCTVKSLQLASTVSTRSQLSENKFRHWKYILLLFLWFIENTLVWALFHAAGCIPGWVYVSYKLGCFSLQNQTIIESKYDFEPINKKKADEV